MAALWARMTTNIDAAGPRSAAASCQPRAGSPKLGRPPGTGPTTATPRPARSAARLTAIATITAISAPGISGPGILRVTARRKHDQDDPDRHRHVCPTEVRERAQRVQEPGRCLFARRGHPEHVGKLPGRHLDADAGQEPDQHGAGQEVRQEPEPGQPGEQQHRPGQQGREPGQLDVAWRPGHRETGQRGGEDDRGRGVRGHHQVARRSEDGEHGHRQQHRVQAGHHRHPGDLRVAEDLGDAQGGQRQAGEHIGGYLGPVDRQQPPHRGQRPQPSSLAGPRRIRQRHSTPRFPCGFGFVHHPAATRFLRSQQPQISPR